MNAATEDALATARQIREDLKLLDESALALLERAIRARAELDVRIARIQTELNRLERDAADAEP